MPRYVTSPPVLTQLRRTVFCGLILCGSGLVLGLATAGGDGDPAFSESFDKGPEKPWRWVREDPDEWRVRDGALELRAQKGRVWSGNDAKNILVLDLPVAGRTAEVYVRHGDPKSKWEQGGLLLYDGDDRFVKLIVEFIDGAYFVVMAREWDGQGKVFTKIAIPDREAVLRIGIAGGVAKAAFQLGKEGGWKDAGTCEFKASDRCRFALFTQDGSDKEVRWVRFDRFRVSGATP